MTDQRKLSDVLERERVLSEVKSSNQSLTAGEHSFHEQSSKKQNPLVHFGFSIAKEKSTTPDNTACESPADNAVIVNTAVTTAAVPQTRVQSCQGIFYDSMSMQLKKGAHMSMSEALLMYGHNCSIAEHNQIM